MLFPSCSMIIRYGSIYNPNIKYFRSPPPTPSDDPHKGHTDHDDFPLFEEGLAAKRNEYDGAMEDFTNLCNEARIFPPVPAQWFAEAALISDPIKVQWWNLHQLNECHPSLVKIPTMVVSFWVLEINDFFLVVCMKCLVVFQNFMGPYSYCLTTIDNKTFTVNFLLP